LLNAGDIEGAISQFRAAIQSVPTYAPAHYQLGLALQRKGDKEGAAQEFRAAKELDLKLKSPKP
jgi:Flp pilus assembly protein TadD